MEKQDNSLNKLQFRATAGVQQPSQGHAEGLLLLWPPAGRLHVHSWAQSDYLQWDKLRQTVFSISIFHHHLKFKSDLPVNNLSPSQKIKNHRKQNFSFMTALGFRLPWASCTWLHKKAAKAKRNCCKVS